MLLKWGKGRAGWKLLMMVVLLGIGLTGFGCVSGLQPIGWSGGGVSDGKLFVGSKEGRLVAVNLSDESRQWSEPIKAASRGGGFGCAQMGALGAAGLRLPVWLSTGLRRFPGI